MLCYEIWEKSTEVTPFTFAIGFWAMSTISVLHFCLARPRCDTQQLAMAEIWEPLSRRTLTECNISQLSLKWTTAVPKYYVKFVWEAPNCEWLLDTTVDLSMTLTLTGSETWVMLELNSLLSEYVGKCNAFIHILIVFDWLIYHL